MHPLCCEFREAADPAELDVLPEFIRTQFFVIGFPLIGRAGFCVYSIGGAVDL